MNVEVTPDCWTADFLFETFFFTFRIILCLLIQSMFKLIKGDVLMCNCLEMPKCWLEVDLIRVWRSRVLDVGTWEVLIVQNWDLESRGQLETLGTCILWGIFASVRNRCIGFYKTCGFLLYMQKQILYSVKCVPTQYVQQFIDSTC